MGNEKKNTNEEILASMLAKIDEAIAKGEYKPDESISEDTPLDSFAHDPRLERAASILRMLDAMRPDSSIVHGDTSISSDDPPDFLPEVGDADLDTKGVAKEQTAADALKTRRIGDRDSVQDALDQKPAAIEQPPTKSPSFELDEGAPPNIGRFEIQGRLGQGGFGVVFLATDPELNRDIALKVPRPQALFSDELRHRFIKEGQAAASLNHANIVPVFESGRAGAVVYLASAYCPGPTLADFIDAAKDSVDEQLLAKWIRQLADGIQHAHQRGVLHRDIKPGNILLSQGLRPQANGDDSPSTSVVGTLAEPSNLVPMLTDFGLAKQIDAGDQSVTQGIVGTPNYMSPEQAKGNSADIGIESDVYSLGAVLFFGLTGRPPFEHESTLALLNAVQNDNPPRLSQLRSQVSTDLEAICMKCLEKHPADRYSSASELADDLQRFLDGEPVRARPVTSVQRLVKWCKRNPTIASLTSAVAVLVLVALIASVSGWIVSSQALARESLAKSKANDALENETQARTEAELAKLEADRRYMDAWEAVEQFYVSISEDRLLNTPGLKPLRQELLQTAVEYYQRFLEDRGDDLALRLMIAQAHARVGKVQTELENLELASVAYEAARDILIELRTEEPDNEDVLLELANVFDGIGVVTSRSNRVPDSVAPFEEALEICQSLEIDAERMPERSKALTSILNNLGFSLQRTGALPQAEARFNEAIDVAVTLCDAHPDDVGYRIKLIGAKANLAIFYRNFKRDIGAALAIQQELIAMHEQIMADDGDSPDVQESWGRTNANIAIVYFNAGDPEKSQEHADQAVETFDRLADLFPNAFGYQVDAAGLFGLKGTIHHVRNQPEEAKVAFDEGLRRLNELREDRPNHPEVLGRLSDLLNNSAMIYSDRGDYENARANFVEAYAIICELRDANPRDFSKLLHVARAEQNLAQVDARSGDHQSAIDGCTQALRSFLDLQANHLESPAVLQGILDNYSNRASSYDAIDEHALAIDDRRECLEYCAEEKIPNYELPLGFSLSRNGDLDESRQIADRYNETPPADPRVMLALARLEGMISVLLDDLQEDSDQHAELITQYSDRAMEHLLTAHAGGAFANPNNRKRLVEEADFDLIRDRTEFQELLEELGL